MNSASPFPLPIAPDFIDRLENRVIREIRDGANEWSHCITALTRWERENLLDNANENQSKQHRLVTENLLHLGKLLRAATADEEFSDKALSGMVEAGVHILEDKLCVWHKPMSQEESDQILREVGLL